MKFPLSSNGLMPITLVYFIFVTTSWTWPQILKHHHGPGHHAHHAHHAVAASSSSGAVYNTAGGNAPTDLTHFWEASQLTVAQDAEVTTALSAGSDSVGLSSTYDYESAHNCTSGSPETSSGSERYIATAGTIDISHLQPATADTTQKPTSTQAEATTTIHITKTSHVVKTVRVSGFLSSIHSSDTTLESYILTTGSVAKRIETTSSTTSVAAVQSGPLGGGYQSFQLGPFQTPSGSTSAPAASATTSVAMCPTSNGTTYISTGGHNYQIVCDIDYMNNDLRFILASSFDECVQQCDTYNTQSSNGNGCVGALFVPSRVLGMNDCYLKSTVNEPTPAQLSMIVAILLSAPTPSLTTSATATSVASSTATSSAYTVATTTPHAVSVSSQPTVAYAPGTMIVDPSVAASHLHGPSSNKPTAQYIDWKPPTDIKLVSDLLSVGVNNALSSSYPPSLDTGILELDAATEGLLKPLSDTPHISRDGGKGGYLNGQHLFIFCDTGAYTAATDYSNGNFLGFVSSSVAIDTGLNGVAGQALELEDGIGQWSDDVGRMRGFVPMTQGEQSYNLAMQGNGQRYAVWPESSLIPLDATNAILYAPIIYDNVNMATRAAVFTYTGAALLTITAGGEAGPVAARTVDKLFGQDEVEWGCIGGIRSWGPSGVGGTDGKVYLFGKGTGGLLLARTGHDSIADLKSYEYWTGTDWNTAMPSTSSTAYFIAGYFMDVDVFYSPRHLTFIIVYLNSYVDNTFYFRYLKADHTILTPGAAGSDPSADYVETLVAYPWSTEQVLYKASPGLSGKYIYAGGVHQGYFGDNDITNGGTKMLLSWTAPTGLDPASKTSEYQLVTADIEWA